MREITIRRAEMGEAELLPGIENSAGQAFRQIAELAWLADGEDLPVEWHRRVIAQGTCWVAVDAQDGLVGFLSAEVLAGDLHIWEVSVRREWQRGGQGRRLIEQAIAHAKLLGLAAVTLTTFRDVTWNELFYARLGFVTLPKGEAGPRLEQVLQAEIERGWPGDRRCAMRLVLTPRIEPRHEISPQEIDAMEDRIYEHNRRATGRHDGRGLGFVLRDEAGRMIGVAAGYTWAGVAELKQMWVDEAHRGRGHARALLNAFVDEATRRGVRRIWVASYDFQAPEMYEKAGFQRMAELEGWPDGHTNVVLCKTLPGEIAKG